jgi:hypothetical protein
MSLEDTALEIALKIGREALAYAMTGLSEEEVRAKLAANRQRIVDELDENLRRIRERGGE